MQERETSIPTVLPPMGNLSPTQVAQKSLTHWVWTPYMDINNMGPFGIVSQLGYRDQRWTEIKRCTPYPLGNLTSYETDREAAEGMTGFSVDAEKLPKIEYVKYAQDQAAELGERYRGTGLRVLVPLIGMNDFELVNQIIQVVQPFVYSIHEMMTEFSTGAEKRIKASNLSDEDQVKARALAKIMLGGAQEAETKALAEYELLISSMSDKSVGQPGISNPNPFHHWICQQLNKEVPERVNRTAGQGNSSAAIDILAKRALKEESAAESMAAQLEQERAERAAEREQYEKRFAALENNKLKSGNQARA